MPDPGQTLWRARCDLGVLQKSFKPILSAIALNRDNIVTESGPPEIQSNTLSPFFNMEYFVIVSLILLIMISDMLCGVERLSQTHAYVCKENSKK